MVSPYFRSVTGASGIRATTYTFSGYNRKTEWATQDGATVVSRSYSYDETDWLTGTIDRADPTQPLTITYDYDKNGNTLKKSDSRTPDAALELSYDAANRLVQSRMGATLTGQYDYNAVGLRVRHYGSERGDVDYFYDDGAVLEERTAGGGLLVHYRYADRLLSLNTGSETQYYHHDALGSTVDLTDGSGSVKVRYTLDPWGQIRNQVGSSVNRMVFTGQEMDEQTGLIYFGARYYDPDSARFLTQDSYLGEPGTPPSLHRYLYAYANPTVYVDPDGHAGYFFDGTGNHPEKTNYDGSENAVTNVRKLYEAYEDEAFYAYGIGSGYDADGTPYEKKWHGGTGRKITKEGITGETMDARVSYMMKNLENQYAKNDKVVDIYGFSRGSATALEFLNRIQDEKDCGSYEGLEVRFVGLFDTVPSKRSGLFTYSDEEQIETGETNWFGIDETRTVKYRFNLPSDMKFGAQPVHAVSIDEQRKEFATVDLNDAMQVGFRGVHSDVGGGYKSNDFDWISLDYMVEKSNEAGVKFKEKELGRIDRKGSEEYLRWLSKDATPTRSNALPTNNSQWYYNDNETRTLPKNMLLHQSVDYFGTAPINDIGGYKYQP